MIGFLSTWRIYFEAGILVILLAALGAQNVMLEHERAGRADDKANYSTERAKAAIATLKAVADARDEGQRRTAAIQEKIDEKDKQLAQARADRIIADAATGRLQQRYAAALAAARAAARDPAAPASSAAAPAGDLPADMFSGLLEVARQYRDAAEDAITSGELAERSYDALTPPSISLQKLKLGGSNAMER